MLYFILFLLFPLNVLVIPFVARTFYIFSSVNIRYNFIIPNYLYVRNNGCSVDTSNWREKT
jgi:hypothetical protein